MSNVRRLDYGAVNIVGRMQRNGFAIDIPYFKDLDVKVQGLMDAEYSAIKSIIPKEALDSFINETVYDEEDDEQKTSEEREEDVRNSINLNSPEQLAELLFKHMGLGKEAKLKTTKNGKRISTGKKQLEMIRDSHPIIAAILRYREYSKLLTTYIRKFPRIARWNPASQTWRIHCSLLLTRAETGRMACVAGSTILKTSRGDFRIDEYAPTGYDTITTHLGRQKKILRKFYKGLDAMYRLTLSNGAYIDCTKDHRLLTPSGWRKSGDLPIGEKVLSGDECWPSGASPRVYEITASTYLGTMGVWDIEVEDDHSYIAQGLIHHNSKNPNLQNIPARSSLGAEVRAGFISAPGKVLLSRDLSQIELRVLAHEADEPNMIDIFHRDGDIHVETTLRAYGLTWDDWKAMSKDAVCSCEHAVESHPAVDGLPDGGPCHLCGCTGYEHRGKARQKKLRTPIKNTNFGICIARGQLVLTELRGQIPIERVLITDRVWDGEEFVSHDGLIFKGKKEVITYRGLTATPDHEVWTCDGVKMQLRYAADSNVILMETGNGDREYKYQARMNPSFYSTREIVKWSMEPVYDLLNAGPRHRFTVSGKLVSNCYGLTGLGLQQQLASQSGIYWTEEEADRFIDLWFSLYPGVRGYMDRVYDMARRHGLVWDGFGRIRLVPGINSVHSNVRSTALREAGNFPIQSFAAGVLKVAMARCGDEIDPVFKDAGIYVEPLMQVHDELLFEVDEDYVECVSDYLGDIMDSAVQLKVPLKSEANWGRRWEK